MALIKPFRDEGKTSADLLQEAEAHYHDAVQAFETLKLYLKHPEEGEIAPSEISRVASDYRRATQTLFDERKKIEDQRKSDAGIVREYAIDFDAARDTIGRLLDRLRAAGGSGSVSE